MDSALEYEVEYFNDEVEYFNDDLFDVTDFKEWIIFLAKEYSEHVLHELELSGEFESLQSPREYNFSTDQIFVNLSEESVNKIISDLRSNPKTSFENIVNDRLTSRSGFISYYSNDYKQYLFDTSLNEIDHNILGLMVEAWYIDKADLTWSDLEETVLDRIQGNSGCDFTDFSKLEINKESV